VADIHQSVDIRCVILAFAHPILFFW
jgi:hypothetical protein